MPSSKGVQSHLDYQIGLNPENGQFKDKKQEWDHLVIRSDHDHVIFSLLSVVLFSNLNSFGMSCLVLEISAVEISAFSII